MLVFGYDLLILGFHMLVFCFIAFHITPASKGFDEHSVRLLAFRFAPASQGLL